MTDLTHHTDYRHALAVIKQRIQTSQTRAVLAVNAELLGLYWDIGHLPRHEGFRALQSVCHAAVLCLLQPSV